MAVRQRSNGQWFVDVCHRYDRYRITSPENSRKGAQAFEAVIRSRLTKGLPVDGFREDEKSKTFKEFAEYWFKTYVETNNKPTTRRAKRNDLNKHIYPIMGDLPIKKISSTRIETMKAQKLKEGLSPKTINNVLSTLRICLNMAQEWGEVDRIPKIKWLKVAEQSFDYLNDDECTALLQHCEDVIMRDMVLCALRTGMRRGELLGLEWSSVDFARNKIVVQQSYVEGNMNSTKNNRIRYIPMTPDLRMVLLERKKLRGFVFSYDGKPARGIRANKWLYKLCDHTDMRRIGWHVLRHTFASHLVMKGVPMRAVQMLLGHSTIQMTERYAHLSPSTLHDAVAVLDQSEMVTLQNLRHYHGTSKTVLPALEACDEYETR